MPRLPVIAGGPDVQQQAAHQHADHPGRGERALRQGHRLPDRGANRQGFYIPPPTTPTYTAGGTGRGQEKGLRDGGGRERRRARERGNGAREGGSGPRLAAGRGRGGEQGSGPRGEALPGSQVAMGGAGRAGGGGGSRPRGRRWEQAEDSVAQQGARPYPSRPCPPPLPDQAEGCPFNRPHPVGSRGPEGTPPQSVGGDGLGSGPGQRGSRRGPVWVTDATWRPGRDWAEPRPWSWVFPSELVLKPLHLAISSVDNDCISIVSESLTLWRFFF